MKTLANKTKSVTHLYTRTWDNDSGDYLYTRRAVNTAKATELRSAEKNGEWVTLEDGEEVQPSREWFALVGPGESVQVKSHRETFDQAAMARGFRSARLHRRET